MNQLNESVVEDDAVTVNDVPLEMAVTARTTALLVVLVINTMSPVATHVVETTTDVAAETVPVPAHALLPVLMNNALPALDMMMEPVLYTP